MTTDKSQLAYWLKHIESFHPNEIALGLERIQSVAERLEVLPLGAPCILVGGTNGKGSCVAMLESLALAENKRVACYTSPHLLRFNERIKMNGETVNDHHLVEAFQRIDKVRGDTALTFFEFTTLAAFWIFHRAELDLIVIEVGLGGRLDATNIIEPDCSVITTIDIDHSDWLGDSLSDIAREKAGILRSKSSGFCGDKKSFQLLAESVERKHLQLELVPPLTAEQQLIVDNQSINSRQLLGQNIGLAISAYQSLFSLPVTNERLTQALKTIRLSGRLQRLSDEPVILLDVAHNPQAVANLARQIAQIVESEGIVEVTALCGMMADKAIAEVLDLLASSVDRWSFTQLALPRAESAANLLTIYQQQGHSQPAQTSASVGEAMTAYQQRASQVEGRSLLLVFGSFITVADAIAWYNNAEI